MSVYNQGNELNTRITNFENELVEKEEEQEQEQEVIEDVDFASNEEFYETLTDEKQNIKKYPCLTRYENARIIGLRAEQISRGAPPLIEVGNLTDPIDIALKELEEKCCPYIIERKLPDGSRYRVSVNELI